MLEWLKGILGETYTEEIDKKVSEEIGKSFVSRNDFNAKNDALKDLQEQLSGRDDQLEKLKGIDAEGLQAQIEKLQSDNKAAKEAADKKFEDLKFDHALSSALMGAKVRNAKAARALLDTEKIKLDGEKILGLDEQLQALKESDGYLFESDKPAPRFSDPTPGGSSDGCFDAVRAAAGLKAPETK